MPLRLPLVAIGVAAFAAAPTPALAQEERLGDMAQALADPVVQQTVARAIAAMGEALLAMNVGPLAEAIGPLAGEGPLRHLPPDARLGDLAGPEAGDIPGKLSRHVPQAMGSAAAMAGAFERMLPEFEAMMARMRGALPIE